MLGTNEWIIIGHTECGMLTFKDEDFINRLEKETGAVAHAPSHFHAFPDLEANIRRQIAKLNAHPWVPKEIQPRGFIYDVLTGRLNEIKTQ